MCKFETIQYSLTYHKKKIKLSSLHFTESTFEPVRRDLGGERFDQRHNKNITSNTHILCFFLRKII